MPGIDAAGGETLVVGAGISGLWAALLLARRGRAVRVIERGPQAGGLAGAETFRGIPCDLGSHRLHPSALAEPLFREMDRDRPFLRRPRRGVLLFGDRRIPYPPTAVAMLRALGAGAGVDLAIGLLARADRRRALAAWERDRADEEDLGFARFVRDRVGDPAYEAFYRPYAEKVWGLDPADLSQTVAKKRVSTTAPWRLVQSLAGRAARWALGREDDAIDGFVYPEGGASSIIAWLTEKLAEHGVTVERGVAFDVAAPRSGPVLFAGDLRDLVPTTLEHRGLYLVYLALPVARAGDAETYYAPDARYWFGRVSEPQNYSPALRRAGETILTVEIPEGRWGRGADFASGELGDRLLGQLQRAGIVPRGVHPIEARQRFVPAVYPLYRRGWRAEWRAAMRRVAALGDVFPFGRQALFLHVNLDHCASIAADVVEHVLAGGRSEAWIAASERYLDLRVRD
jgi:glycine/D-amino acid oxidase-like deaminating enzyme